jgi:acetoin utilization protein AcuB
MQHLPTLKSLMTPFPYAIDVDASLAQAHEMMTEHAIRHLPVTQEGQLVGVVTDRDIPLHTRSQLTQDDLRVRDVYVSEPYVVDLNERLDTVLLQMATRHIGSALVVRRGRLAGIFTAIDACRGFGLYLCAHLPPTPDDEAA